MAHLHHGGLESFSVLLTLTVLFTALVYVRGWLRLRSTFLNRATGWRAGSFFLGLFLICVALASPVAVLNQALLTGHMIQHLVLMTLAAPLILLGEPVLLLSHGLPRRFVRAAVAPLISWRPAVRLGRMLVRPALCWLAAVAAIAVWHVPAVFALGMQSAEWHAIEQFTFLGTGLLFWWPVVQPWPSVPKLSWSIVLYLFLATLPCDIFSGFLVFSERVVYSGYLSMSREAGMSALSDQQCAGALMWTCVTVVYLVAGAILSTRLLSPGNSGVDEFPFYALPVGTSTPADFQSLEVF